MVESVDEALSKRASELQLDKSGEGAKDEDVKELQQQVSDHAAVLDAIKDSIIEVKNSQKVAVDKVEQDGNAADAGSQGEKVQSKLSQLDQATSQVKDELDELKSETQSALKKIKSQLELTEKKIAEPSNKAVSEVDPTAVYRQQTVDIHSHEADIMELNAKVDELQDRSVKEAQKLESEIKSLKDSVENRMATMNPGPVVDETEQYAIKEETEVRFQAVEDKIESHIQSTKEKMLKQGQLFSKMQKDIEKLKASIRKT